MTTPTRPGAIPDAAVEAAGNAFYSNTLAEYDEYGLPEPRRFTRAALAAAYPAIREAIMQEVADFILREYSEGEDERIIAESIAYYLTIKGIDAVTETEADRE